MKQLPNKLLACTLFLASAVLTTGCARPFELGYDPAYSADERGKIIARNWDYEGKQITEDVDHIFLLRPMGHLTYWDLR